MIFYFVLLVSVPCLLLIVTLSDEQLFTTMLGSIISFYILVTVLTLTLFCCVGYLKYSFKIISVKMNEKGVFICFSSGYCDYFSWDKLRCVNELFEIIVLSDNNYLYIERCSWTLEFYERLEIISNGNLSNANGTSEEGPRDLERTVTKDC